MFAYKAYGLNILSEIAFPEFHPFTNNDNYDLTIRFGPVPLELNGADVVKRVHYEASSSQVIYKLHGAGRILIKDPHTIIFFHEENGDLEHLRNQIRGRAIAAIFQLRKKTVLHGSVISYNKKAILFLGRSGSGKSTLMGAFVNRGYPYLSDDLAVLTKDSNGDFLVEPAYPKIRLWQHAIDLLGEELIFAKGKAIRKDMDKYFMLPPSGYVQELQPISHIYVLSLHHDETVIENLSAIEQYQQLLQNVFAKANLLGIGGYEEQFKVLSYLATSVKIKIVKRPLSTSKDEFSNYVDIIEKDFKAM